MNPDRRGGLERPDGSVVRCYAPGGGHLSFAVEYEGKACPYGITEAEAQALCPAGWTLYRNGPYYRARANVGKGA